MILKLRQITQAQGAIERLSHQKLPVKAAYRVSRALTKIDKVLKTYNQTIYKYMQENGSPREDGSYFIPHTETEKVEAWTKFHGDLLDEEEELDIFKIQIDLLPESFEIPPADLIAMEFLFEDATIDAEVAGKGGENSL